MKKMLIYDDEEQFKNKLKESLANLTILKDFEIVTMSQEDFEISMESLNKRQIALRNQGKWNEDETPTILDDTSIFVIDFDLVKYKDPFLTGEAVAYLARCFTRCGLIVGVNQYRGIEFDLTLKGHLGSFADLNVTEKGLGNPNLWGNRDRKEEFRPWYWPILPNYQKDFEQKVEDVEENLDSRICEALGFPSELFDMLPRSISQFIGPNPVETTFRKFVEESGNGIRSKDAVKTNDNVLTRIGAARISKWLERLVLPELDILVDAPHLVARYPSLMTGDIENIETWNKTTQLTNHTELGLRTELIESFRLKKDYWLSRPVWFWDKLRECEKIDEVREPWKTVRPDWVFCEDMSLFCEGDYREFVADVESPFARRFVKYLDDVEYRPRVRFSL